MTPISAQSRLRRRRARGLRRVAPLTGWADFRVGRATRTAYGITYPFDYDRRHALSLAGNLKVSPRLDLSATGRWAAGLPRTPVRGVRLAYRPPWGGERLAFYADFLNIFNASNFIQIDSALVFDRTSDRLRIVERAEDRGIPFFPSFGIRVWF